MIYYAPKILGDAGRGMLYIQDALNMSDIPSNKIISYKKIGLVENKFSNLLSLMFSGIIEDLGKVKKISPNGDMTSIIIQSNLFLSDHKNGDSITGDEFA